MRDGQSADTASDDLQRKVRALQREIMEVRHAAGADGTASQSFPFHLNLNSSVPHLYHSKMRELS